MKKIVLAINLLFLTTLINAQTIDDLSYGTDNSFEVISWNIEMFPLVENVTVDNLSQLIPAIDADVIAFQEVADGTVFNQMIDEIPGYEAYVGISGDWVNFAFIYKTDVIQVNNVYEIYTNEEYDIPFLRKPYVMELTYDGDDYVIINNHLKAMGDGLLNTDDIWDEENRRFVAVNLLKDYMDANFPDDKVIVLGDMNDILTDDLENNVFQSIFNNPDNYAFADYEIAIGDNSNWSYPGWPSHIDHILITNELFNSFYSHSSSIETLKIENYLPGGMTEYNDNISDHRPVALKIFPNETFIFNKDFEDQSLTSGGWLAFSVAGDQVWTIPATQYGHNYSYYGAITGYDAGAYENEDWLISPEFNADNYDDLKLSFWNTSGYTGSAMQLLYSADFVDNPETATWQEIPNVTWHNGETLWEWTFSEVIDLSELSGTTGRIAFKYTSTTAQAATWEVDDILLTDAANSFSVSADVNISGAGSVSGTGVYVYGETITLAALAEDGYNFVNWTEAGTEVSTNSEYIFEANSNINLLVNFETANATEIENLSEVQMYPNPSNGKLFFEGKNIQSIEIYDVHGTHFITLQVNGNGTMIDLSDIPCGLYIVRFATTYRVSNQKLILR